jgi:hypothetical protein
LVLVAAGQSAAVGVPEAFTGTMIVHDAPETWASRDHDAAGVVVRGHAAAGAGARRAAAATSRARGQVVGERERLRRVVRGLRDV